MNLVEGADSNYAEYTVYPRASVMALAENPDFNKKVLKELREKNEHIDLRGPLREYMSCFVSLHNIIRETTKQLFQDARNKYEAAIKVHSTLQGREVKYPSLVELSEADEIIGEVSLVDSILKYYDQLLKRNVMNNDIHLSAASNAHQRRK
jgi:hypothetical protein